MTLECAHQTWKRVRLGFPSTNFYLWWAYNVVFLFGFLVTNAACVRLDHPTQTLPKINIAPPLKLDDWKMIHVLLRQEANFHVFLLLVSSDVSGRISLTSAKSTNQICARSSFASMLLMPQTSKRKSWLWRVLPKFCWFSCRLVFIHCFFYLNIYIYIYMYTFFTDIWISTGHPSPLFGSILSWIVCVTRPAGTGGGFGRSESTKEVGEAPKFQGKKQSRRVLPVVFFVGISSGSNVIATPWAPKI